MIWPTKRQWQWKRQRSCQRQWQWQRQRHLENTLKERPMRLLTFQTFDQSDKDTWPDQQKDMLKKMTNAMTKTIAKARTMTKANTMIMTMRKAKRLREHPQRATQDPFDLSNIWSEWWGDNKTTMAITKTMTMTNKPKNTFSGVTMTKNLASSAEAKTLKPVYIYHLWKL